VRVKQVKTVIKEITKERKSDGTTKIIMGFNLTCGCWRSGSWLRSCINGNIGWSAFSPDIS